jgi:hypothetical protein
MFDLDADDFSDSFVVDIKNIDLMRQALEGSREAYNELQMMAAKAIIAN